MAVRLDDGMIEYVSRLANLELSPEEKETAKADMGRMLDYLDRLDELDTSGIAPMSHVAPIYNVFREDVVANGDDRENILRNAPETSQGMFKVPRAVDEKGQPAGRRC